MTTEVQLVGADAAMRSIERWAEKLAPEVDRASADLADRVAGQVQAKVPVVSGRLAASVGSQVADEGVEVTMGEGVPYAAWIEFGGSRGRSYVPQGRYVYPTALAAQDDYAKVAADAASDFAERFSWPTPAA